MILSENVAMKLIQEAHIDATQWWLKDTSLSLEEKEVIAAGNEEAEWLAKRAIEVILSNYSWHRAAAYARDAMNFEYFGYEDSEGSFIEQVSKSHWEPFAEAFQDAIAGMQECQDLARNLQKFGV